MPVCAICRIAVPKSKLTDELCFFRFPRDPQLRKEWVKACNMPEQYNPEYSTICCQHFFPTDFERNLKAEHLKISAKKILRIGIVPSVNLPKAIKISHHFDFVDCSPRTEVLESMVDENTSGDILKDLVVKNSVINLLSVDQNQVKICSNNTTNGLIENNEMPLLKIKSVEKDINAAKLKNGSTKNNNIPRVKGNTTKVQTRKTNSRRKGAVTKKLDSATPKEKNQKLLIEKIATAILPVINVKNQLVQNDDITQIVEKLQEENRKLKNNIQKKNDELKECKRKIAELMLVQTPTPPKRLRKVPKWLTED